ncbi:conserved protein of unknown function [Candidatus Nitrospira inopinata]|jgi:hypothetical protein|uniref:Uncharacterized protein n=1 Tax=Candidatus Nitrospira inopinata TaxID=1715989 RepID=A0A0S4KWD5_9BACT|nr:conserved protein of unknown function [Candidatus Nitrospira inopinata]
MPVNLDPENKRPRFSVNNTSPSEGSSQPVSHETQSSHRFGDDTEDDRDKALAEAEWKNLWEATEVIDMDTF